MSRREAQSNDFKRSCNFCRARKILCNRQLPCTSCSSRGIVCQFSSSTPSKRKRPPASPQPTSLPADALQQHQPGSQQDLLAEIQALKKLTQSLETRILINLNTIQPSQDGQVLVTSSNTDTSTSLENRELNDVVAHLERVSQSHPFDRPALIEDVVLRIERLQAIQQMPACTAYLGMPARCIWLPDATEAKLLVTAFIDHISYLIPIFHGPTLIASVDEIYDRLNARQSIAVGSLVLLLSIIAMATHLWNDDLAASSSLAWSADQAHAQTALWIRATHIALDAGQSRLAFSLSTVQGICLLSFLICNLEGHSLQHRSLISDGLLYSRELKLHRIDDPTNLPKSDTIQMEMGRRVWWYLVTIDW